MGDLPKVYPGCQGVVKDEISLKNGYNLVVIPAKAGMTSKVDFSCVIVLLLHYNTKPGRTSFFNSYYRNKNMSDITGIILAGGRGKRLGYRNKALLEIGGKQIIQRIIETLSEVTDRIMIMTNFPEDFTHLEFPTFSDIIPNSGPLGGIYTGLKITKTQYNIILACDMPFIQPFILNKIIDNIEDYDIIVPVTPDGYHPTTAIYSKNCLDTIEKQIQSGHLKISSIFSQLKVKAIEFAKIHDDNNLLVFFNVNTHKDYMKAVDMVEKDNLVF
ncbi:NTP transferase domain-containing protein [Candidatus Poribacteria bacterium]|nr:NTP transferase domain-containing protein [Candidatus Poribacteria bacterium]